MQAIGGNNQATVFNEYYKNTFGNSVINFNTNRIHDIIQEECLLEDKLMEKRKILVLYCHNETDPFGESVCANWFNDNSIGTVLANPNFVVTAYNITSEYHRMELVQELRSTFLDVDLFHSIMSGESKIYVLVPYLNKILCQMHVDSSYTSIEFLAEIFFVRDVHNGINNYMEEEMKLNEEIQTCKTFQQIMYDKLGNKDYHVFFKDEHKCLKDNIGYGFFGPPSNESGYNEKQQKHIEKVFNIILNQSEKYASEKGMVIVSIIYVCCVNFLIEEVGDRNKTNIKFEDFVPVPIFILRKCKPKNNSSMTGEFCRIIIDNTLRVYTSWKKFLKENKYPKYVLCIPKNGEYSCDSDEDVILEFHFTPACNLKQKVLKGIDITSAVTGIGSGGLLAIAAIPAVTLAPVLITGALVAGAGAGIYAIGRSIANIVDRGIHEQDLSFSDAEARAAYINIAAGALGFVGAGANALLANMARSGVQIGKGATITFNMIGVANLAGGGSALGNSFYDVTRGYVVEGERPSPLVMVQLGASALFFGNAVYNFRTASTIVSEAQNNSIQEIRESLRSNRHRRTFTKMHKESIRVSNGDAARGNAKVISTMRNVNNVDETMAILTRNNKRFNELGVKFSAEDGHFSLNGRTMDITKFAAAVNKDQISEVMMLPQEKLAVLSSKSTFKTPWAEIGKACVASCQSRSGQKAVAEILNIFKPLIQRKIIELINKVFKPKNQDNIYIMKNMSLFGVGASEMQLVLDFICDRAREELKLGSFGIGCEYVFQALVNYYLCGKSIVDTLVTDCVDYLLTRITRKLFDKERVAEEKIRIEGNRDLQKCNECIGYYHYH